MTIDWNQVATKREQLFFGLSLLVIFFFYWQVLHMPHIQSRNDQKVQLKALTMERNALEKFIRVTPTVVHRKGESSSSDRKLSLLEQKGPTFQDIHSLLPNLTASSFLKGVEVESFSFQSAVKEKGYIRTDFLLETMSNFTDLMSYLKRLEEFPALFHIMGLVLTVEGRDASRVKAQISGRFFSLGES